MKVGQEIWLRYNGIDRRVDRLPEKHTITKVGNKYFYINQYGRERKFEINTLMEITETNYGRKAYLSLEEINLEDERNLIIKHLRDIFGIYGITNKYSIDQLRRIKEILSE